jgi:anti-anti-sigma factor
VKYVPYIDSDGLKLLIDVLGQPCDEIQIDVVNASRGVARTIAFSRLGDYFPLSVSSQPGSA